MSLPILPKYELCCGCHACYSACPHDSIEMNWDFEGFMYPHIDEMTCTECKQCEIACPTLPFLHTAPYDSVRKKSTFPKVMPNQTLHFIALENAKIALGGGHYLLSKNHNIQILPTQIF